MEDWTFTELWERLQVFKRMFAAFNGGTFG